MIGRQADLAGAEFQHRLSVRFMALAAVRPIAERRGPFELLRPHDGVLTQVFEKMS